MVTTEMIITLCILAFMVIMLLTHKLPYGVTAMICCVLFVLTGVARLGEAFAGFSNSTTILVATMIALAGALGKTSLVARLRRFIASMEGKSGLALVLVLTVACIALSQLMGQIACMTLLMVFIQNFDEDSDINPGRMIFVMAVVNTIWTSKVPIGMGATMPGTLNAYYQGLVNEDPALLLGLGDYFKAGILPALVGTIYCIFCYKLIPSPKIDRSQIHDVKDQEAIPMRDEILIFVAFGLVLVGFMLNSYLPSDVINVLPAVGILLLLVTKVLSVKEVTNSLCSDMVFMIAGMSVMSSVLAKTGVGELIGQTVLNILGGNPSALMVSIVFCVFTTIMTNFLSNMGTMALMCPIAASTALVGGMNVQACVLIVAVSAWFAVIMPTGCASAMMAFGVGNHNPFKTMKFTLPLVLLMMIALIIGVNIFFPIYG